jgi:hypothetical protein
VDVAILLLLVGIEECDLWSSLLSISTVGMCKGEEFLIEVKIIFWSLCRLETEKDGLIIASKGVIARAIALVGISERSVTSLRGAINYFALKMIKRNLIHMYEYLARHIRNTQA